MLKDPHNLGEFLCIVINIIIVGLLLAVFL